MPDITCWEAAEILDPPMTAKQVRTLIELASIPLAGRRPLPGRGRPLNLYNQDQITAEHATEAARTTKQFIDNDWIAEALLGRSLITADPVAGMLYWPDGSRAEVPSPNIYGLVKAGPEFVAAHRVIWIAGDGPIPEGIQINHINHLRWDNRRANLELVTHRENLRHRHGSPYLTYTAAVAELAAMTPAERAGNDAGIGYLIHGRRR